MEKNKRLVVLSLFLLSMVMLHSYLPLSTQAEPTQIAGKLVEALEATGAQATDIQLRTSTPLGSVSSASELLAWGQAWSKALSLSKNDTFHQAKARLTYQAKGVWGQTSLSIRLIGVVKSDKLDTYLVVTLEGSRDSLQDIENLHDKVVTTFKKWQVNPSFSTCIRGIYSDKLIVDWQENKIQTVLGMLRASEVERLQDESVTSVSAYTEQWHPFLLTNGHKMNVQIAAHVDTLHQVTRVTIGTPIITAEY